MSKIRVGVFGGGRGHSMISVLYDHPDATLVAVCDKYQPLLDRVREEAEAKNLDVALFTDFDEFIKYDMDAVVLANYATEHATFAIKCLRAGKHVMSEVLPCETMAQAVELIEAVEETGLVYTYAENYCYSDHAFEMRFRYEAGEIGSVTYCEGEYIHDCARCWPQISYGERDHWRRRSFPNFYCTHSIGPMLFATGRRPVQVIGFETPPDEANYGLGVVRGAGIEMITLDNGAIARSVHGWLKREPALAAFMFYGTKGMMESRRFLENPHFNIYRESDKIGIGEWEKYNPEPRIAKEYAEKFQGHGGADFYATHFFIEKLLGRPDGNKYAIDVYSAVDMGICGILAYRSVLNGNIPVKVPNLRNKAERDAYRNDNACTTPEVAGEQLLPLSSYPIPEIGNEVFDYVRKLWQDGERADYPYKG